MEFFAKTFDELTTKELYEILKSRSQIFTIEQNIHCQDMDDIDYNSLHCYIMDDNKVVAYLRAFSQDDAQKHAVGFYKKFGFRVSSDDFLEDGIVHQKMELCTHF